MLLALLGGIVVAERYRAYLREQNEPLDSRSDDPNGTSALRAWSESLGYRSAEDPFDFYAVPPKTDLVFFFEPTEPMAAADWDRLAAWVTGGGVLVMAAEESLGRELFERRLGVVDEIGFDFELTAQIDTASPFFNRPIVEGSFEFPVTRQGYLVAEDDDYVVHLSRGGRPVLISKQIGAGQVF